MRHSLRYTMKAMLLAFFLNSFFLCLMRSILAAQEVPAFITDSLDTYIRHNMTAFQIPGLALCVVKDGKVIAMKTFGRQKFSEQQRISPSTIFPIASVTKTFTGTAMTMLEAEKKLSLDDNLTRWVPYFSMKDSLYSRQIALTDILSHRSGWKTFQGDFLNTESSMTTRQMLEKDEDKPDSVRTTWNCGFDESRCTRTA
jgi:CubicO group peptidase (beta-lactamase class C family)